MNTMIFMCDFVNDFQDAMVFIISFFSAAPASSSDSASCMHHCCSTVNCTALLLGCCCTRLFFLASPSPMESPSPSASESPGASPLSSDSQCMSRFWQGIVVNVVLFLNFVRCAQNVQTDDGLCSCSIYRHVSLLQNCAFVHFMQCCELFVICSNVWWL